MSHPCRGEGLVRHLPLLGAGLAALAGLLHLGILLAIFARRLGYPFDLEWMEGGMLCHALRVMEGRPIYAAPSAEFISYLYTPLYPFLLALLGKVVGLSYLLGRLISALSFLGVLALVYRLVVRQAGGGWAARLWGVAAMGLAASSFPRVGAWYDLVRGDSLYLLLVVAFLYLIAYRTASWRDLLLAGLLAGLAFLTKQTASLFIVFSGLALLLLRWRRLPAYVGVVALVAGGTVLLLNARTDGWFWQYTFAMHQGHDLYWDRVWPGTELHLLRCSPAVGAILGLWLLAAPVFWLRQRRFPAADRRNLYWLGVALTGVLVSAVGFATQWAAENAYIPGLVLPAAFAALAAADLVRKVGGPSPTEAAAGVALASALSPTATAGAAPARVLHGGARPLLGGLVALILGGALAAQLVTQLYSPTPHLPTPRDRQAGEALIEWLRQVEGEVLVPYHPYYPVLAGKRPGYHQMGVNDVTRAGHPFPPDLQQRIASRAYGAVLLDNPPRGRYDLLLATYKLGAYFAAAEVPQVVTGYRVRPTYLFVPKVPEPVPAGDRRIFGFEEGSFAGWTVEGNAFGDRPAGGPLWDQGPVGPFEGSYLVNSYHGGDAQVGLLRSQAFVVDRPFLSYRVGGGHRVQELMVRLLVEDRAVHVGTGSGTDVMEIRRVDVRAHAGRSMRVELLDRAVGPWGHLLFDDLVLRSR